MQLVILSICVLFISFIASIYKVEEANFKLVIREKYKSNFAFLSTKAYMQFFVFFTLFFFVLFVNWNVQIFFILLLLATLRFIFWVLVNTYRGYYKDAKHQKSTNFTMLENFSGPIGALFVFGVYNYIDNSHISIFWYILTPFIGVFLLWALRADESKISTEMIFIILFQALLVCVETGIILYLKNSNLEQFVSSDFSLLFFIDSKMILFLIVISFSSFLSGIYFFKDILNDYKLGVFKEGLRLGILSGLHDIFYFMGFMFFGPIFLIARRGVLIPLQNLYLNLKDGKNLKNMISSLLNKPLISLNGGKDFIISFVDLVFNQTVKFIIKLLS